uniref:START domain-containing protein n=1 Tax=Panagrellus redivivus TaxID=6233 RepID=A0A7E4V1W9_PANRE
MAMCRVGYSRFVKTATPVWEDLTSKRVDSRLLFPSRPTRLHRALVLPGHSRTYSTTFDVVHAFYQPHEDEWIPVQLDLVYTC